MKACPHPSPISAADYSAVELLPDDKTVVMLDQRRLPMDEVYETLTTVEEVARAIEVLAVRGAPAIGIAAAYGVVLGVAGERGGEASFAAMLSAVDERLRRTRPTAVNLMWALDRMRRLGERVRPLAATDRLAAMAAEARAIHKEDVAACRAMGELGARLVPDGATILTHCNAGALATGGYGTALGVVRAAREAGKRVQVFADETRPVLQGARLTAWELHRDGIPVTLITDGMAASLFAARRIDLVVVGADRIAASGDVANKIGTYGVACLAHMHDVPFYVAAPWSTVDLACPNGASIPIEQRSAEEVLSMPVPGGSVRTAPLGISVYNPAFDVTPARLVRAIHTERGTISPVSSDGLAQL